MHDCLDGVVPRCQSPTRRWQAEPERSSKNARRAAARPWQLLYYTRFANRQVASSDAYA